MKNVGISFKERLYLYKIVSRSDSCQELDDYGIEKILSQRCWFESKTIRDGLNSYNIDSELLTKELFKDLVFVTSKKYNPDVDTKRIYERTDVLIPPISPSSIMISYYANTTKGVSNVKPLITPSDKLGLLSIFETILLILYWDMYLKTELNRNLDFNEICNEASNIESPKGFWGEAIKSQQEIISLANAYTFGAGFYDNKFILNKIEIVKLSRKFEALKNNSSSQNLEEMRSQMSREAVNSRWSTRDQHFIKVMLPLAKPLIDENLKHHQIAEQLSKQKDKDGYSICSYELNGVRREMKLGEVKGKVKEYLDEIGREDLIHGRRA